MSSNNWNLNRYNTKRALDSELNLTKRKLKLANKISKNEQEVLEEALKLGLKLD